MFKATHYLCSDKAQSKIKTDAFPRLLTTCKRNQTIIKGCSRRYRCVAAAPIANRLGLRPDVPCGLVRNDLHKAW